MGGLTEAGPKAGLRILITNKNMAGRGGTQLYAHDVAVALRQRGHCPIVYAPELGEVAQALRAATVPVIDSLDRLTLAPDVIHGQHHLETMSALLHFPTAPAVYFCHGWESWNLAPVQFPRIYRYVAVDDTCLDRLVLEHGIAQEQVQVILNFVDLERFAPRPPLPATPRRALVFGNDATATHVAAVREACRRHGVHLDVAGQSPGQPCAAPEKILGHYDLVFAKARCALEAMAVGAAVVLFGKAGVGALVTQEEWPALRRANFGVRVLRGPHHPDALAREMARYDAADAAAVSRQVRACAGLETAVTDMIELYQVTIAEHAAKANQDPHADGRAAAAYLRWAAPTFYKCHQAVQVQQDRERASLLQGQLDRRRLEDDLRDLRNSRIVRFGQRLRRLPLVGRLSRWLAARSLAGGAARGNS